MGDKNSEKCVTVSKNRPLVTYKVEKLVQSVELYAKLKKSERFASTKRWVAKYLEVPRTPEAYFWRQLWNNSKPRKKQKMNLQP